MTQYCVFSFISLVACLFVLEASSRAELPSVDEAVSELVAATQIYDEGRMQEAIHRLALVGEKSLPPLISLLRNDQPNIRWQAVLAIHRIGIAQHELGSHLPRLCGDDDADVRGAAVLALVEFFPELPATKKLSIQLAADPHSLVQANALYGLWRLDQKTNDIERLANLLSSKDWMTVEAAEKHLVHIGAASVPILIGHLDNVALRVSSIRTLGKLGELALPAKHRLTDLAASKDLVVAAAAANALSHFGPQAIHDLESLLSADQQENQLFALRALLKSHSTASPTISKITPFVENQNVELKIAAIHVLGKFANRDAQIGQSLAKQIRDPRPEIRAASIRALSCFQVDVHRWRQMLVHQQDRETNDYVRKVLRSAIDELEKPRKRPLEPSSRVVQRKSK